MKYEVIKKTGSLRLGQIVNDKDPYVRRKIQEGGCLKPLEKTEKKMDKTSYENKAIDSKSYDNKSVEHKKDEKKGDN